MNTFTPLLILENLCPFWKIFAHFGKSLPIKFFYKSKKIGKH